MRHAALLLLLTAAGAAGAAGVAWVEAERRGDAELPVYGGACGAGVAAAAAGALGGAARAGLPACGGAAWDSPHCVLGAVRALAGGGAALCVPLGAGWAACAARWLAALRVQDAGDAAPPARRACLAASAPAPPPPLLALADPSVAVQYQLSERAQEILVNYTIEMTDTKHCEGCVNGTYIPAWCEGGGCATLLVEGAGEVVALGGAVRRGALRAAVRGVRDLPAALAALHGERVLACGWPPQLAPLAGAAALAPPPCAAPAAARDCSAASLPREDECPFETRRLAKLLDESTAKYSPHVARRLQRLAFSVREQAAGGAAAAAGRAQGGAGAGAWRVLLLAPLGGRGGAGLAAAARAAEQAAGGALRLDVQDARCSARRALYEVSDAVTRRGAAAVAGGACEEAAAAAAALAEVFGLPSLSYTAGAAGRGRVLAAGAARQLGAALGALLAAQGWRRVAVLSDAGAAGGGGWAALLGAQVLLHHVLPDHDHYDDFQNRTYEWSLRAEELGARVLVVASEDELVVEAALCGAGGGVARGPGRGARGGAVWLLAREPPAAWWRAAPACARAQAPHVLSVAPAWAADWRDRPHTPHQAEWISRWREQCDYVRDEGGGAGCGEAGPGGAGPGAAAALLHDALLLWTGALRRLPPPQQDLLYRRDVRRQLIEYIKESNYSGLTGQFEWEDTEGGGLARRGAVVVTQWGAAGARRVAEWGAGGLRVLAPLQWVSARPPDDGAARCVLQPLADALAGDCRAALGALLGALLAALLAALGGGALHVRRARERRRRGAARVRELPPPGPWEVPRERVVINRKLGVGAFGTVYGGHARLAPGGGWTAVAVKTLRRGAGTEDKLDFLSEAEAMKRLEHENIVRLLGVVTASEPVCIIMEFQVYGDLKTYLLARRHLAGEGGDAAGEVSARTLTALALGAARALGYLAQQRCVHRDVAARNCLVSARRTLKLGDFGMTRLVFEHDYYRLGRRGLLPVRWMAPESLALGVFSPASDIWSFGVLLYEMVTLGALPWAGLSNAQVLARVTGGQHLPLPPRLPPQLAGLMRSCWAARGAARPAASEVVSFLATAAGGALLAPSPAEPLELLPAPGEGGGDGEGGEGSAGGWGGATDSTELSDELTDDASDAGDQLLA